MSAKIKLLSRLTFAWIFLGIIGSLLLGLLSWIIIGSMRIPLSNYIIISMFVLGFLPGLFGSFTLRFVGLFGLFGIFAGFIWGFFDVVFDKSGFLWSVFFVFDVMKAMMIAFFIGFLAQLIFWFIIKKKEKLRNYR